MNLSAMVAVLVFSGAFLSIFAALYFGASKSHSRGEMGFDGISILRWALLGFVVLYALLGITAILD